EQGQDVAQPHVQAQQPQAQGHIVAQAVAMSEAHAVPTMWRPFL
ncbi:hypothetical protein A2U01_0113754, partial [Trifolium medium]|nr:hypothetical protein [Trifolium medium]